MDKSWINLGTRVSKQYQDGIKEFMKFAYKNRDASELITCPCRKCVNQPKYLSKIVVFKHLEDNGFLRKYTNWIHHGEPVMAAHNPCGSETEVNPRTQDDMIEMLHEAMGIPDVEVGNDQRGSGPNEATAKYLKLLESAQVPLYPGCTEHTALSFIVRLLHKKAMYGWSDKSFTELLKDVISSYPKGVVLPQSYYEARKIARDLGFSYTIIDACPNHCMLFKNEDANLEECAICKTSRWEKETRSSRDGDGPQKAKKVAVQQVRHYPLKPRLQRLFMCSKTAHLMRWHAEERIDDGVYRHLADSMAWKHLDKTNDSFGKEPRNVRLGLASDGFCPFRKTNTPHSTWPVILTPYNLPPSMCMKKPFLFLSLLIDGPKGPGDKIDVYMQLVVEELQEFWHKGVETYDASRNEMFQLYAALLWTINDFPAYANLSGWSTKGQYACPCCNSETNSVWLKHGKKWSYGCHRKWLPGGHSFLKDAKSFNGLKEFGKKPKTLSGSDLLRQMDYEGIVTNYKKIDLITRKRKQMVERDEHGNKKKKTHNWKKRSILYELPYWEHNLIRHNIDVMHTEKNVCDNVLWTILGDSLKSKDNMNSRRDLKDMNIRPDLHLKTNDCGKEYQPEAEFEMNNDGKYLFLSTLHGARAPDGHASNISRRVQIDKRTIGTLKSHDNHILLQELIPVAIRHSLPHHVVEVLIELSSFFKQLCSHNSAADLEKLRESVVITICKLEQILPPSFFDIMEHLPIHLADEPLIGGAVQFRWMYPVERFLFTLKEYVRNHTHPEASIAEGYLMAECMSFCSLYLNDVDTLSNRPMRHKEGDGDKQGNKFTLSDKEFVQAHRWILFHTKAVTPYLKLHLAALHQEYPSFSDQQIQREHFEKFACWFEKHVHNLPTFGSDVATVEINTLANGPHSQALKFNAYTTNGYYFRVKDVDWRRTTQNSGVTLKTDTMSVSTGRDMNPRVDPLAYYGRLTDIIEISYSVELKFVLFKCDWVNATGTKVDSHKFTLVNFNHLLYQSNRDCDEPFILASQAHQVWYVRDVVQKDWHNIVTMRTRDLSFDVEDTYDEAG